MAIFKDVLQKLHTVTLLNSVCDETVTLNVFFVFITLINKSYLVDVGIVHLFLSTV